MNIFHKFFITSYFYTNPSEVSSGQAAKLTPSAACKNGELYTSRDLIRRLVLLLENKELLY